MVLGWVGLSSGVDMELIRSCAAAVTTEGWGAAMQMLKEVNLLILCAELLIGCAVTCAVIGAVAYSLVMLLWRKR